MNHHASSNLTSSEGPPREELGARGSGEGEEEEEEEEEGERSAFRATD